MSVSRRKPSFFQCENVLLIGDRGFIGQAWHAVLADETGNVWFTPKRTNQHDPLLEAQRMGFCRKK